MSEKSTGDLHDPGLYEIRVRGHLDSRWGLWFDGMGLSQQGDGSTLIHGPVVDQAALYGLLQKVRDLGLALVSLTRLESDQPDRPDLPSTEPAHS